MADSIRTNSLLDGTYRLLPALDSIEEVTMVVFALGQMNFIRADDGFQQRFGMCFYLAAFDKDPAIGA